MPAGLSFQRRRQDAERNNHDIHHLIWRVIQVVRLYDHAHRWVICEHATIIALSGAVPIISVCQNGSNAQTVAFEAEELIGNFHWRFDVSLATKTPQGEMVNSAIDDASPENIKALVNKAKQLIAEQHDRIEGVAKMLAQPKAKVQPQDKMPPKGMMMSRVRGAGV